jgi:hypothetical protein
VDRRRPQRRALPDAASVGLPEAGAKQVAAGGREAFRVAFAQLDEEGVAAGFGGVEKLAAQQLQVAPGSEKKRVPAVIGMPRASGTIALSPSPSASFFPSSKTSTSGFSGRSGDEASRTS